MLADKAIALHTIQNGSLDFRQLTIFGQDTELRTACYEHTYKVHTQVFAEEQPSGVGESLVQDEQLIGIVDIEERIVKHYHRIVVIDNGEVVSDMANGGVLHYDSKTGYQPVPNVTEMKTITLHNVSFQNAPVTQVIEPQAPAAVEEPVEIEVPVETAPAAEEPTLSFAEATLKEIELDIEAKRGGDSNG